VMLLCDNNLFCIQPKNWQHQRLEDGSLALQVCKGAADNSNSA